jgi:hypothetical protein
MTRGCGIYVLNYCTAELSIQCQLIAFRRRSCLCFPHLVQNQIMDIKNYSVVISPMIYVSFDTYQTCFRSYTDEYYLRQLKRYRCCDELFESSL